LSETKLGKERVIRLGDAGWLLGVVREKEDFVGAVDGGDLRGDRTVFGEGIVPDHQAAADWAGDFSASDGNAAEILRAVVFGSEVEETAVGGKARAVNAAIKGASKNIGLPAC
jgi:hypothetical protein